jgi:hypothetical protein
LLGQQDQPRQAEVVVLLEADPVPAELHQELVERGGRRPFQECTGERQRCAGIERLARHVAELALLGCEFEVDD